MIDLLYYQISSLVITITSFFIGFYIIFRTRTKVTIRFFIFCMLICLWSFQYFLWQTSSTGDAALFWSRGLMAPAIFIAVAYWHFVVTFLNKEKKYKKFIAVSYFIFFLFFLSDFTPFFVNRVEPALNFPFWPKPGPLYHPFVIMFFFYYIYLTYLLVKAYKKSENIKKKQIKYLLIGIVPTFAGGSTNYFLWYDIFIPPIGNILALSYVIFTAYAISRFRLMITPKMAAENITKTMSDYMIAVDNSNKMAIVNDSLLKALNYERTDLIDNDFFMIFEEGERRDILKYLNRLKKDENSTGKYESIIISKHNEKKAVSINGSLLFDKGIFLGYVLTMSDITDMKRYITELKAKQKELKAKTEELKSEQKELSKMNATLEERVQERTKDLVKTNQKLEREYAAKKQTLKRIKELNTMKGKFIRITTHQLRTPLTTIRWCLESLQKKAGKDISAESREFIDIALNTEKQVIGRANDMFATLDIDNKKLQFSSINFSMNDLVKYAIKEARQRSDTQKITFKLIEPSKEVSINGDPEKIKNVIEKLIDNAIQYSPHGSDIKIQLKKQDNKVRFEIEDTGIGISEKDQSMIFTPFFRTHDAGRMHTDGTGVSLSIAKYYIERHGGKIGFRKKAEKGTVFWFEVPIERKLPSK